MTGQQLVTAGPAGRELAAPASAQPPAPGEPAGGLPEGVLARVTPAMAAAIGTVAAVAMAEAAFNLGRAVYTILELPLPLAIGFPAIFEAAAGSFAVQDMRDRRAGHASTSMRVATYLTLVASSIVNGIVGWLAHGGAGLVEVLPPLVLAAVIHLHGDRATRAHHSQAVLRPAWRQAQLDAARRDAVLDVLPLLAGDSADAMATVALLRRWMESGTLTPSDALIAAGWHARGDREISPARLRRLETVAAAVWGPAGPPAPARPAGTEPVRRPRPAGTPAGTAGGSPPGPSHGSPPGSLSGSGRGSSSGSSSRPAGTAAGSAAGTARTVQQLRARTFEDLITELEAAVGAGNLTAASSARAIRDALKVNAGRADALHAHLQQIAVTPPQLRVLHSPGQAASPGTHTGAGDGAPGPGAEGAL